MNSTNFISGQIGYSELLSEHIGLFHKKPLPWELSGLWIPGPTGSCGITWKWDPSPSGLCGEGLGDPAGSGSVTSATWATLPVVTVAHSSHPQPLTQTPFFPLLSCHSWHHYCPRPSQSEPLIPRQPADMWCCFLLGGGVLLWPLKFVFIARCPRAELSFDFYLVLVYLGVCSCNQVGEGSESGGLCAGSGMNVPSVWGGGGEKGGRG